MDTLTLAQVRVKAPTRVRVTRERLSFVGLAFLSTVLNGIHLDQEGYANTYYAATVKSMLQSWHNFYPAV